MFSKKTIGAAIVCALAVGAWSSAALATPVDVNGVTWNTDSQFNLTIQSLNLRETSVSKPGDVLSGYGQIGSINSNNGFCQGCDLTFTFQYTLSSVTGNQAVFNNGSFQFYTNAAGSYNAGDPASASNGTPWVTLTGHTSMNAQTGATGQLFSSIVGTVSHPTFGSTGFGLVDATGGAAQSALDIYKVGDGMGGFANLSLISSFQDFPANGCSTTPSSDPTNVCHFPIEGNGSLTGRVTAVPEPGALGMLGLGAGILGLFFWRRRKEATDRV